MSPETVWEVIGAGSERLRQGGSRRVPARHEGVTMAYEIEGRLLEACTCNVLCPCWVGQDPDGGTCDGVLCWHVDRGVVDGVDVSGRTFTILTHIPGNILAGNWKVVWYIA